MGKYIAYLIVAFVILFALNFFNVIDIPFLDVPDFKATKEDGISRRHEAVEDAN